jgi:hypothetical protein
MGVSAAGDLLLFDCWFNKSVAQMGGFAGPSLIARTGGSDRCDEWPVTAPRIDMEVLLAGSSRLPETSYDLALDSAVSRVRVRVCLGLQWSLPPGMDAPYACYSSSTTDGAVVPGSAGTVAVEIAELDPVFGVPKVYRIHVRGARLSATVVSGSELVKFPTSLELGAILLYEPLR